jgi:transcriptional regulator with XRE-family HTH domain
MIKYNNYYQKLGKNIRMLRKARKLTQENLANVLGISQPVYQGKETGRIKFHVHELHMLCNLFGISVDSILPK